MRVSTGATLALLFLAGLSGCIGTDSDDVLLGAVDVAPYLGYLPAAPDMALRLVQESVLITGADADVEIYLRIVRPDVSEPLPVIAQFTPYTAPGTNAALLQMAEPAVGGLVEGRFDHEFVRRGYVFAYADVRGTGDSSGCLDLRGAADIADLWHLTEFLGTQSWSSGKVGFIGASYPGSEAHMAALAGNEHLGAVVPVVASTSFYHYHHNDGVPYSGQHSLGGTNTGYTSQGVTPTANPASGTEKLAEQAECPHAKHAVQYGGLDQTGTYDLWWMERNLRSRAVDVQVPVLMAQGLADWNVKPDHIATWFNDLTVPKTLIAGQWGHAYPRSVSTQCTEYTGGCDPAVPYGNWWQYVSAFWDTHLKGIDTGMFQESTAWVQDQYGSWHRSADWPILPEDREELVLHLTHEGGLVPAVDTPAETAEASWYACPHDQGTYGTALGITEDQRQRYAGCDDAPVQQLVFESEPFAADTVISGVPLVDLTLRSDVDFTHLVVVLERIDIKGETTGPTQILGIETAPGRPITEMRENYGYLNPSFRNGLEAPEAIVPGEPYTVTVDMYPQEDLVKAGEKLRLTVRSNDGGRTIEAYDEGTNALLWGDIGLNRLILPLRPADLQGVRLAEAAETA